MSPSDANCAVHAQANADKLVRKRVHDLVRVHFKGFATDTAEDAAGGKCVRIRKANASGEDEWTAQQKKSGKARDQGSSCAGRTGVVLRAKLPCRVCSVSQLPPLQGTGAGRSARKDLTSTIGERSERTRGQKARLCKLCAAVASPGFWLGWRVIGAREQASGAGLHCAPSAFNLTWQRVELTRILEMSSDKQCS